MKQAVIRQVKSLSMSCDRVGNLLLAKFSFAGAKDSCVVFPAGIVFWLLNNVPVNQDPNLQPPAAMPGISQDDWDQPAIPRVLSVQCKQFAENVRMHMELDRKPDLTVVLDRSNLELLRQVMEAYRGDLMDLDA